VIMPPIADTDGGAILSIWAEGTDGDGSADILDPHVTGCCFHDDNPERSGQEYYISSTANGWHADTPDGSNVTIADYSGTVAGTIEIDNGGAHGLDDLDWVFIDGCTDTEHQGYKQIHDLVADDADKFYVYATWAGQDGTDCDWEQRPGQGETVKWDAGASVGRVLYYSEPLELIRILATTGTLADEDDIYETTGAEWKIHADGIIHDCVACADPDADTSHGIVAVRAIRPKINNVCIDSIGGVGISFTSASAANPVEDAE
ncbi:unnamed protein product, partial [marine sediment metagenome]